MVDFGGIDYKVDYSLKNLNTFNVGGNADYLIIPKTVEELERAIIIVKDKMPYCVIGGGSNILVSDKGFKGAVILTTKMTKITVVGNILTAECGAKISTVFNVARKNNLGGLEFCVGIPGTIGGVVAMNGGCFNKSISEVVCYVLGEGKAFNNKDCQFDYRYSRFQNGGIISKVGLRLTALEDEIIDKKVERFVSARSKSQPKGQTCGSVFQNDGYFAGKLIDQAGLKGYRIGGATISTKHANFIINEGGTSQDIYSLIQLAKEKVLSQFDIELKEEVKYIGEF